MSEVPHLLSLSEAAQSAYPNTSLATAIMAKTSPRLLDDSIKQVFADDALLGQLEGTAAQINEIAAIRQWDGFDAPPSRYMAAQVAVDTENLHSLHHTSVDLAEEVLDLRHKLSKPIRAAVVAACTLTIGATGFATIRKTESSHGAPSTGPALVAEDVGGGVALGMLSGVITEGSALSIIAAHRRARRRARRSDSAAN